MRFDADLVTKGLLPGEYIVRISKREGGNPDSPELLPAQYNTASALRVTVEGGDIVFDFALASE